MESAKIQIRDAHSLICAMKIASFLTHGCRSLSPNLGAEDLDNAYVNGVLSESNRDFSSASSR